MARNPWATLVDVEMYRDAWLAGAEWAFCNCDKSKQEQCSSQPRRGLVKSIFFQRLKAIERKQGSKTDYPSRDEIEDFWNDEAKLTPGSPVKKRKRAKKNVTAKPDEGTG